MKYHGAWDDSTSSVEVGGGQNCCLRYSDTTITMVGTLNLLQGDMTTARSDAVELATMLYRLSKSSIMAAQVTETNNHPAKPHSTSMVILPVGKLQSMKANTIIMR